MFEAYVAAHINEIPERYRTFILEFESFFKKHETEIVEIAKEWAQTGYICSPNDFVMYNINHVGLPMDEEDEKAFYNPDLFNNFFAFFAAVELFNRMNGFEWAA